MDAIGTILAMVTHAQKTKSLQDTVRWAVWKELRTYSNLNPGLNTSPAASRASVSPCLDVLSDSKPTERLQGTTHQSPA